MRILFLSAWFPYPPDNGSKIRIYALLRGLARAHEVTLLTFTDQLLIGVPAELAALCRNVHAVPRRSYHPTSLRALLGFLSPTPRVIVDTFDARMATCVEQELKCGRHDAVVASQWGMAAYLPRRREPPGLLEEVELGVLETKIAGAATPLHRLRPKLTWLKLRFYLRQLLPRFAACTVVSESEAALLRRVAPGYQPIEVIPNCISLVDYSNQSRMPKPNTLIFTGSFRYAVNYDAMLWFLNKVFPRIRAEMPSAELTITGDHAGLPLPVHSSITLTGRVEDVRPLVSSSWVSVAPILMGGGTRLKILEAMALGTPVVATSKGAEGLEAQHGEHLLVADTPESFAEAVVKLLGDPDLRHRLVNNAHLLVRKKYDWDIVMPRFLNLVDRVAQA